MRRIYYSYEQDEFLKTLSGKTILNVQGLKSGSGHIYFYFSDKSNMTMFHEQDCCESVFVDDIDGDESDLIGSTIISVELVTNCNTNFKDEYDDSCTWSFYKIKTTKGYVVIRWYGCSNGFYSEAVDIEYNDPNIKDDDFYIN